MFNWSLWVSRSKDFLNERKEGAGAPMPFGKALEAVACAVAGGEGWQSVLKVFDSLFG